MKKTKVKINIFEDDSYGEGRVNSDIAEMEEQGWAVKGYTQTEVKTNGNGLKSKTCISVWFEKDEN